MPQSFQEQLGRYRIAGELGRGAMGVVYRATDPAIGRTVAIKTIRIRDIDNEQQREKLRERLFREARSAGVLSHPNIVTIYDMDEDDGVAYIAMAFVNGPSLEKILATPEPLSGARMLRILRQAAQALDYAHAKGIVHRDVKPANIMTDEDGSVKITDFGIAKIASASQHNETKTVSGTPNYMSPEQVQGLPVDGRSDQFSLAVIAFEILTGERPFSGEHLSTIVYRIVTEDPPTAQRLNGTLTPRINEVLRKALAKNPAERFPNCSSFVGALELACAESRGWKTLPAGAAAEQPTVAVERPLAPEPPKKTAPVLPQPAFAGTPSPSRRRSLMLPLLMSLLVVSGLGAIFVFQAGLGGKEPEHPEPVTQTAPAPLPAPTDSHEPDVAAQDQTAVQPAVQKPAPGDLPASTVEAPPAEIKRTASKGPEIVTEIPARVIPARLQDIYIATTPAGANVVLDQNEGLSCATPCQLHATPGVHHISVSAPGYMTEFREIHVSDAALDVGQITLRQPMGTLMLTTNPSGARIRVNGELVSQVTPAELPLRPGAYAITVEKDGLSRTERIQIRENPFYLRIPLNH